MSSNVKNLALEDMRNAGLNVVVFTFEEAILNDTASIEISIKFDGRKLNGGHNKKYYERSNQKSQKKNSR